MYGSYEVHIRGGPSLADARAAIAALGFEDLFPPRAIETGARLAVIENEAFLRTAMKGDFDFVPDYSIGIQTCPRDYRAAFEAAALVLDSIEGDALFLANDTAMWNEEVVRRVGGRIVLCAELEGWEPALRAARRRVFGGMRSG